MSGPGNVRYCHTCGVRLASGRLTQCASCQQQAAGLALGPPDVGPGFWGTSLMREALGSWHIGQVIRAYRHHPHHGQRPLSQELVAGWLRLTQTQLSRIENGLPVKDLDKLTDWADTADPAGPLVVPAARSRQQDDLAAGRSTPECSS